MSGGGNQTSHKAKLTYYFMKKAELMMPFYCFFSNKTFQWEKSTCQIIIKFCLINFSCLIGFNEIFLKKSDALKKRVFFFSVQYLVLNHFLETIFL